jgi:hypothetical protein
MAGGDDDDQPVAGDAANRQRRLVDVAFHQANFGGAVEDGASDAIGVADRQPEVDRRVAVVEADDALRQPVAGNGLAGL